MVLIRQSYVSSILLLSKHESNSLFHQSAHVIIRPSTAQAWICPERRCCRLGCINVDLAHHWHSVGCLHSAGGIYFQLIRVPFASRSNFSRLFLQLFLTSWTPLPLFLYLGHFLANDFNLSNDYREISGKKSHRFADQAERPLLVDWLLVIRLALDRYWLNCLMNLLYARSAGQDSWPSPLNILHRLLTAHHESPIHFAVDQELVGCR